MQKLRTTYLSFPLIGMDYMFSSRNNENLRLTSDNMINQGNLNLSQEDPPVFLQFPLPFLDDMDTPTVLHHHLSTDDGGRTATETTPITTQNNHMKFNNTTTRERLASKLKCVRKKRSAGKKDRHSKIHTAQGLRDRRMRLSVHTARKFFDLNDMLGFDKASKTIEWLFSKSKEAIDEVTESLQGDDAALTVSRENHEIIESPLSACETESVMEIVTADEKDENLKLQDDQIDVDQNTNITPMESCPMMKELSGKEARARAIESARDRMENKHLEKLKQLFEADPRIDFNQSQLGILEHHDHPNMEESSGYPLDFSNTYHFLKQLHLDNTGRNTDTFLGNITAIQATNPSIFDYNKTTTEPPTGWLNSKNTFLGFLGGWDSGNSRMGSNNGIVPNIAPLVGSMTRENTISGIISSNYRNFHSENQGQ